MDRFGGDNGIFAEKGTLTENRRERMLHKYVSNLEKYLKVNLNYEIKENCVEIRVDNEIRYLCNFKEKSIYFYERDKCSKKEYFLNDNLLRLNFALEIISNFSETPDYSGCIIFRKASDINELSKIAKKCFKNSYYSINKVEESKLSLIYEKCYKIIFRCNGEDYLIAIGEQEEIFERFYCEIVAFSNLKNEIKKYEEVFNESFTDEEIFSVTGYENRFIKNDKIIGNNTIY